MEIYVPDCYQENIFKINYELLKSKGIKCLLFDMDNTIVLYKEKNCSDEIKKFFDEIKKDFKIIIFSNSPKKRVENIANILGVEYISRAFKPNPKKFLELFKEFKLNETEIAIIGDQLLTDVKGGNNVGITTILVNPLSKKELFITKFSRKREKKIIKKLCKKNLFMGRFYDEKV